MPITHQRSYYVLAASITVVVLAAGIVLATKLHQNDSLEQQTAFKPPSSNSRSTELRLGTASGRHATYTLERVTTPAAQEQGLSGRDGLAPGTGMIFSYSDQAQRCMWMKDMRFNIDIVWLDGGHRVTSIVPNLSPSSYPQDYCALAQDVIELAAGEAAKNGLRVGQAVQL